MDRLKQTNYAHQVGDEKQNDKEQESVESDQEDSNEDNE